MLLSWRSQCPSATHITPTLLTIIGTFLILSQCPSATHITPTVYRKRYFQKEKSRSALRQHISLLQYTRRGCVYITYSRSALRQHISLLPIKPSPLRRRLKVAVPFGNTYHSYYSQPQRPCKKEVAVPFGNTYHSYRQPAQKPLCSCLSQCPSATHITPTSQRALRVLPSIVAVPFGNTYHSYPRCSSCTNTCALSQCPSATHITPTRKDSVDPLVGNRSQCPSATHITPTLTLGIRADYQLIITKNLLITIHLRACFYGF